MPRTTSEPTSRDNLSRLKTTKQETNRLIKWSRSASVLNLMYIPALALFSVFILYPFIKGIQISFTNWDGYSQEYGWVQVDNYIRMLKDPIIGNTIKNTFIYGIGSTFFKTW